MSHYLQHITVQMGLSEYGDALIYGSKEAYGFVPATYLKHLLFAWHEDSFYGTELEVEETPEVELIVLPAEQVIPYFASAPLLHHVQWNWEGETAQIRKLAPYLARCLDERKYLPSLASYRKGKLQWSWDQDVLLEWAQEDGVERDIRALLKNSSQLQFVQGLQAAFSATVFRQYYNSEAEAADLRREYPQLFDRNQSTAGLDEETWLVSIGWKSDTAPFRPALQLLEPEDSNSGWRLQFVLQDKADETILVPVQLGIDGHVTGKWPEPWNIHVQDRASGWLEHLRATLPRAQFAETSDILQRPMNNETAWRFLTTESNRLLQAGWLVLLPAWWEAARRKKPKLRAKVSEDKEKRDGKSFFGLDALIDFDWRVSIGDTDLSEEEFLELAARNERLVLFRGQWIALDPELLEQIRRAMNGIDKRRGLSFQDVLQLHLMRQHRAAQVAEEEAVEEESTRVELEVELNEHLTSLIEKINQQVDLPLTPIPAGLQAQLRPYQHEGYSWLSFLRKFGLGACLADDMGLGKTVQLITYLLHIKEHAEIAIHQLAEQFHQTEEMQQMHQETIFSPTSLVICPTSVLGNWQKEISRFAPSLTVALHYGSKRRSGAEFQQLIDHADVILTSYATASLDQELLQSYTWATICLDEAQNIKNAQTRQSQTVRSLSAMHRVALTGTPIENRLAELWSIYDFITPGYLGTAKGFQERFSNAIEKDHDEERTLHLQRLVKPFMLRRTKKDPNIQLNLPEKNEMKTYIHLTAEQGVLYDQAVNSLMQQMNNLDGIKRKGAILSALTQLKQLCDHPILVTKEALPEPEKGKRFNTEAWVSRSAKLERLLAMVKELREEGEQCLIFTQYIGMGQLMQKILEEELQENVLYLNGSTSKTARDRMIEQFQAPAVEGDSTKPSVFILSLKAGGVGLNLTAANHVFHVDRWWNPAVENQATDRAYRMGQTRDVQVHKFISLGTLEERIDEMLESKQQLSDNVISNSEGWITELSNDALKDLFALRREWSE